MEQELRVRVLGRAELAVSGRPLVELASAKAAALLVYLAVTGSGHSRSALAGLLWVDPAELRATAAAGLRRLRRYARTFPMARPRALTCLGWSHWLQGRHRAAHRAWARVIREGERLAMPWELAHAHHQLGRHLAAGERSPLGLDPTEHLDRARSTFEALGTSAQGQGP